MRISFRGGVHPKGHKEFSREAELKIFHPVGEMVYPLSQHIGKPAKAVVKKNDPVLVGQLIGEADGFVSANIVCTCSGTVKAIEKRRVISGAMMECVVVENDGQYTPVQGIGQYTDPETLDRETILERVRAAGIVGLGGAGFPTHVKLQPKDPSAIRWIIANGSECEPYITCNDQLMRSRAEDIVAGVEVVLRLFPNAEGVIGIEKNKPEAIAAMEKAVEGKKRIRVLPLKAKYPQGGEHSLIKVVSGMDYPVKMLPADVGCIVSNVGTLYAIGRAAIWNEPLVSHPITVTGDAVKQPGNFIVPEGTSIAELIDFAGGLKEEVTVKKALTGGPMMGWAISSYDVPVQKTTNALTLLTTDGSETAQKQMTACLRCGRCTTVCPIGLMPQMMAFAVEFKDMNRYENKLHGLECISCGSCTYICPAKRPLTQTFKEAKAEIMAQKRAAGGGK